MKENIEQTLIESSDVIKNSILLSDIIEKCIQSIVDSLKNNKKIIIFGNGGSAADSQHIAAEMIGKFMLERKSIPAISLTTDSSILTSLSNDYSYDVIYSRMIESKGRKGDVLVGISTSGNSKNVVLAMKAAQERGMVTIGFTGEGGGDMKGCSDILINVPSNNTPRIQECHILAGHIICELTEATLFGSES